MSLYSYISRMSKIHFLIKKKRTGNPVEFAKKMDLSRSALLKDLSEMKELGFPIEYDKCRRTYRYNIDKINSDEDVEVPFEVLKKILGGKDRQETQDLIQRIFYEV